MAVRRLFAITACLLWHVHSAAALQDSSEFALNVFSDIAPIVSLFGEQFATQFLSQSMAWYDHVIFAMVPIGIVTIVVGVIRVSGPPLARAFIGRARENRALAELDLMSSISNEVCEMFNGLSIVRAMGKPRMGHFIILPRQSQDIIHEDIESRVHTLRSAVEAGYISERTLTLKPEEYTGNPNFSAFQGFLTSRIQQLWTKLRHIGRSQPDEESQMNDSMARDQTGSRAIVLSGALPQIHSENHLKSSRSPAKTVSAGNSVQESKKLRDVPDHLNIQLNLVTDDMTNPASPQVWESILATTIAIVVQGGIIAVAAVTVLYAPTRRVIGYQPESYALPCYIIGTVVLSAGVGLCSLVIEQSTEEKLWDLQVDKANPDQASPHLIFLQPEQKVQDMEFGAAAIFAGEKAHIITSRRSSSGVGKSESQRIAKSLGWETLSVIGALVTISGFVIQYIGLRGLPYPCAFAHLGAIFLLAFVRATFRRRIGKPPPASGALAGHELDYLAFHVVLCDKCFHSKPISDGDGASATPVHIDNDDVYRFISKWEVVTPRLSMDTVPTAKSITSDRSGSFDIVDVAPSEASGVFNPEFDPVDTLSTSSVLVRMRKRTADLCRWKSEVSEQAAALAKSIGCFTDVFIGDGKSTEIKWRIQVATAPKQGNMSYDIVEISIKKQESSERWMVDEGDIESIMSLWMMGTKLSQANHSNKERQDDDWREAKGFAKARYDYIHVLGPSEDDRLERDMRWWLDDLHALGLSKQRMGGPRPDKMPIIGCNIEQDDPLSCRGNDFLPAILAKHLFNHYIWSVGSLIAPNCLRTEHDEITVVNDNLDPWQVFGTRTYLWSSNKRPGLRHSKIDHSVQEIEICGLANRRDLLLCILPVFSFYNLLPNNVLLDHFCKKALQRDVNAGAEFFKEVIDLPAKTNPPEQFAFEIVARVLDYIQITFEPYDRTNYYTMDVSLKRQIAILVSALVDRFPHIVDLIGILLEVQHRKDRIETILHLVIFGGRGTGAILGVGQESPHMFFKTEGLTIHQDEVRDMLRYSPSLIWLFQNSSRVVSNEIHSQDIFGWTPSHYASIRDEEYFAKWITWNLTPNPANANIERFRDSLGRNIFHMAVQGPRGAHRLATLKRHTTRETRKKLLWTCGYDGMTTLHVAAQQGTEESIREVLMHENAPADVWDQDLWNKPDRWGRFPSHLAAKHAPIGIGMKILALSSARADVLDDLKKSSLHHFLQHSSRYRLETGELIEISNFFAALEYHDIRGKSSKWHVAAELAEARLFQTLSPFNDSLLQVNRAGRTPLDVAIIGRKATIAMQILDWLEDGEGRVGLEDKSDATDSQDRKQTSLMLACENNLDRVSRRILSLDSKVLWVDPLEKVYNSDEAMLQSVGRLGDRDSQGLTALHYALRSRSDACSRLLLADGYNHAEALQSTNESLLVLAIRSHSSVGVIKRVIERWPGLLNTADNSCQMTPLLWACYDGTNMELVRLLLDDSRVDNNATSAWTNGYGSLHIAVRHKNLELVNTLIGFMDLDLRDAKNRTALELAREKGHLDSVRLLSTDFYPTSSDFWAMEAGTGNFKTELYQYIGRFLPKAALELNDCPSSLLNNQKDTFVRCLKGSLQEGTWKKIKFPCHLAALLGDLDVIGNLLELGAPDNDLDPDGWTWVDYWLFYGRRWHYEEFLSSRMDISTLPIPLSAHKLPRVFETSQVGKQTTEMSIVQGCTELRITPNNVETIRQSFTTKEPIGPRATHFYFEMEILKAWPVMNFSFGYCDRKSPPDPITGWRETLPGPMCGEGIKEGLATVPLELGVTLGCGIDLQTRRIYMTSNGREWAIYETTTDDAEVQYRKLYPYLMIHVDGVDPDAVGRVGLDLRVNLGQELEMRPFRHTFPPEPGFVEIQVASAE